MYTIFYVIATKDGECIEKYFTSYTKARDFANNLSAKNYEVHLKRKNSY